MPRAAPSRTAPSATSDLEAGTVLKLGEYANEPCLNNSEARLVLERALQTRKERTGELRSTTTLDKTREYLHIFAVYKEIEFAQQIEGIISSRSKGSEGEALLTNFEKSQLGTLVPSCADEAKTLIPSLQGKIGDAELDELCGDLQRLKRQAELNQG